MTSKADSEPGWGNQFRLVASEKWKAKSAAMGEPVTNALVEYARPAAGMQVLDLASGTGEPAISLALRVGERGHVTALDLSADLLEIASRRAHTRSLRNFSTHQADAHSLPFDDDSFDLATSRFGVMFFRDAELAMRELLRVLRPGARACFLVWGPFEQPYWQSMMGVVHRHVGGLLLAPGGRIHFVSLSREACRRFYGAPASARYTKRQRRCHGHGLGRQKKCGSRRRPSRCRFVPCWSGFEPRIGRAFMLKCMRKSGDIGMERK